jgi:hypothetical protein
VPDEVGAGDVLAVEEPAQGGDQVRKAAGLLGRAAVARQVERVHGAVAAQRLDVEQPVVQVAAEAVQEHDRLAALARAQEAQAQPAHRHGLRRRPGLLLGRLGDEGGLEVGHEGVDVGVGHARVGDHAEQAADRDHVALRGHPPAEDARRGRLDRAVDLLRLDLGDLGPHGQLGALVHEPRDEPPLGHGQAPLGHAQLLDRRAHRAPAVAAPATSRTAAAIWSGDGM